MRTTSDATVKPRWLPLLACLISSLATADKPATLLESSMIHLRRSGPPEWTTFADTPQADALQRYFESKANNAPWTLSLRQQDVKQSWHVRLNGTPLGQLVRDENDLRVDYQIPAGVISEGDNQLEIRQTGGDQSDDIRVGQIEIHAVAPPALRRIATVQVVLVDWADQPLAGRITVVDPQGTLMPLGAVSGDGLAVRQGVIYTANGEATFGVRPGTYRIIGSRGLEYSIDSARIKVGSGQRVKRTLRLKREIDTRGWVACDTHVHTVTHSGHGDCTIAERMVTLAGEGVELPIATDHNKQIDYRPIARSVGVESYFTPVMGNEVTTRNGHFNIFPVASGSATPDHTAEDWQRLFDSIFSTPEVRIAILNHARDIHAGFRPFSPRHYLALTGENLDDWPQRFTAMEIINSGAVQTDIMELFRDWCGLINRGLPITPVGCSDSHDVTRYIVGQGRTYIQCDDDDPGAIDVASAVQAFSAGRVLVSYGLLTQLTVNGRYGPGDLVPWRPSDDRLTITADVRAPHWSRCRSVELFLNGIPVRRHDVPTGASHSSGITVTWTISRDQLQHDVWLTAVARGPGIRSPHWPTAKPYQPDSPEFTPSVFSSTGAIRVDVDGDGEYRSPRDQAARLLEDFGNQYPRLLASLDDYDASVIYQVMSQLQADSVDVAALEDSASKRVRTAMSRFQQAWRASARARVEQAE